MKKLAVYLPTMWENLQVNRIIADHLPSESQKQLLLITGARQTGKTFLVKKLYPNLPYYNLDAIEFREQLSSISTFRWAKDVGSAVLDEVQKEPALLDKIKYSFDEGNLTFSVLTGSSQILLSKKIRETLTGRITIRELFPFMLKELIDPESNEKKPILLEKILSGHKLDLILNPLASVLTGEQWDRVSLTEKWLFVWGGMPPLIHIPNEEDRKFWLSDYTITYLERDLKDLVNLSDLMPFKKFQRIAALRAANLISYTELAKDSGIGIETARRYLEYLRISYQAFFIHPFYKNLTSSQIKSPKLFWTDNGLLRHLSELGYSLNNGQLYENYIAGELNKYLRTVRSETKLYFYRTRSGMEIDFILETPKGLIAIESKNRDTVTRSDFKALSKVAETSDKSWIGSIVTYRGNKIQQFGENQWAIPSCRLFS